MGILEGILKKIQGQKEDPEVDIHPNEMLRLLRTGKARCWIITEKKKDGCTTSRMGKLQISDRAW